MNKIYFLLYALCLSLTACNGSTLKQELGLEKTPPDEFSIITRAPLSLPAEYDLPAPRPGAARPQEASTSDVARTALLGQPVHTMKATSAASEGAAANALLVRVGAGAQNEDIRQMLDQEQQEEDALAKKKGIGGLILRREQETKGEKSLIDATAEAKRVQETKKAGQVLSGTQARTTTGMPKTLWQRLTNF
jgi:hypothetical protein